MTDHCTILNILYWLLGVYFIIGFLFAIPGLGIALYTCKEKHDFGHICSHMQAMVVNVMAWPISAYRINKMTLKKIEDDQK